MKLLASGIKKNQDKVVKAVKTLSGSMKTNLNTPVGDMGDKVRSVVSGFASTITGSTSRVRSAASGLASGIRTGLMSGLEGMTSEFQSVWSDLGKITKTSVGSMSDEVKQGFSDMKTSIGDLSDQTSSLGNAIRSLGDTFNSDFLKGLGEGISKVGDTVSTVYRGQARLHEEYLRQLGRDAHESRQCTGNGWRRWSADKDRWFPVENRQRRWRTDHLELR